MALYFSTCKQFENNSQNMNICLRPLRDVISAFSREGKPKSVQFVRTFFSFSHLPTKLEIYHVDNLIIGMSTSS